MNIFYSYINSILKRIADKDQLKDFEQRKIIFNHILVVHTTGILMWIYTLIAMTNIDDQRPGVIGLVCSSVHLLSPLLFKWKLNNFLVTSITLASGVIHQGTFAFFTGGFSSPIIIWYGVIPMLAGVILNRRAAVAWAIVVIIISIHFLGFSLLGYDFPNLISAKGFLLSQILLVFGWIILTCSVFYFFQLNFENRELSLKDQKNKMENLLRILLHDMSNSIQVLKAQGSIVRLGKDPEKITKALSSIQLHSEYLSDTIKSIRYVYLADAKEEKLELQDVNLDESISMTKSMLSQRLSVKKMTLKYIREEDMDPYIRAVPHVFEGQVLMNIISNSIKFSQSESEIIVRAFKSSSNPKKVIISIKDQGIGIPPEVLQKIMGDEDIVSRRGTSNERGSGLGIRIMKNFVKRMNGHFTMISKPNEGTETILEFNRSF